MTCGNRNLGIRNAPANLPFSGMAQHSLRRFLTRAGALVTHPAAFAAVLLYVVLWFIFDPSTLNWQGVATLATWAMTLFIARSQYRDTQALEAKLDELLRGQGKGRIDLTTLDDRSPHEIVERRNEARQHDRPAEGA